MKKSSLIGHVLEVLELILSRSRPADAILAEFFRSRHYLGSKDRRQVAEIVYGILRNYLLLGAYVEAVRKLPEQSRESAGQSTLELYVAYARVILKGDPSAILSDISPLWTGSRGGIEAAGFIEELDQTVMPSAGEDPGRQLALVHSMPREIVDEWVGRYGDVEAERLCRASNLQAPTTIRVNTLRFTVEQCHSLLLKDEIETRRTGISPAGLILEKRVNAQSLGAFREGAFEMQDEGSQLLSFLLEPAPGSQIVDACAGAGGKTLHIAALMSNRGSILAIDTDRRRLGSLQERAARAGVSIVETSLAGAGGIDLWTEKADAVLIDAPCTGTGTFRRNPGAKLRFDWESVARAAERQRAILEEYSRLLRPGGRLVYATCSLLREENEDVVNQFLGAHKNFLLLSAPEVLARQNIVLPSELTSPFLNLLPHQTGTDGFFGAVLVKNG
jgi:16S rRNA (cytosine967-C5)-methyltransferase